MNGKAQGKARRKSEEKFEIWNCNYVNGSGAGIFPRQRDSFLSTSKTEKVMSSVFTDKSFPFKVSPMPVIHLIVSAACSVPSNPGRTPMIPASTQPGMVPASGG